MLWLIVVLQGLKLKLSNTQILTTHKPRASSHMGCVCVCGHPRGQVQDVCLCSMALPLVTHKPLKFTGLQPLFLFSAEILKWLFVARILRLHLWESPTSPCARPNNDNRSQLSYLFLRYLHIRDNLKFRTVELCYRRLDTSANYTIHHYITVTLIMIIIVMIQLCKLPFPQNNSAF